MTYDDLMKTIRGTVSPDQWIYHDMEGVYTYRPDLNIRIERKENPDDDNQFHEKWANRHPDPSASRQNYAIYYGSTLVETFMLVSVDGGRASVPMPGIGTEIIPRDDYLLARVVSNARLDEYIKRSGLTVED